jgi:tetratricopeptide (TPR) repeat protein
MATGSAAQIEESEEKKAIELETAALTNIAMCYLKLGEPRKTIEFCQKALTTNPSAWKAVLRKSEAQASMGNYDSARSTLNEALQMAPDSASKSAVMKEREKQTSAEREATIISNAKQKKAFSKMFEKDAQPDSSKVSDEKS